MFIIRLLALMVLLVQRAPSSLGFQGSSHCVTSRPPRSSVSLAVSRTVDQMHAENPNAHKARRKARSATQRRRGPQGQEWINKSVEYYTTVMRKEGGSMSTSDRDAHQSRLAKRLYHAIQQVRSGNLSRAESIYRKTIQDIQDEDDCSNAELATTTLLLALVLQRMGNIAEARMVFHRFFRSAVCAADEGPFTECKCTAKVLGAYALFEMRFGSVHRSMELARRAAQFDGGLSKIFDWKQFRDADEKISGPRRRRRKRNATPCSFAGEVALPADAGPFSGDFRVRAYRASRGPPNGDSEFTGREPSVIYYAGKPPLGTNGRVTSDVPIRIHGASVESAIFESERCKHKEQLELSMQYIQEHGGAIIHFEPEAQGTSIAHGVAASVLKKSGIGRVPRDPPLGADVAQYSVIPSLLEDMGIDSIRLVSGDPSMVRTLRELGVDVRGMVPLVVDGSTHHERSRSAGLSSALTWLEDDDEGTTGHGRSRGAGLSSILDDLLP